MCEATKDIDKVRYRVRWACNVQEVGQPLAIVIDETLPRRHCLKGTIRNKNTGSIIMQSKLSPRSKMS